MINRCAQQNKVRKNYADNTPKHFEKFSPHALACASFVKFLLLLSDKTHLSRAEKIRADSLLQESALLYSSELICEICVRIDCRWVVVCIFGVDLWVGRGCTTQGVCGDLCGANYKSASPRLCSSQRGWDGSGFNTDFHGIRRIYTLCLSVPCFVIICVYYCRGCGNCNQYYASYSIRQSSGYFVDCPFA